MTTNRSDLLYSIPKVFTGSELSEMDMLTIATHRYPNKKHIALKHWIIIDIIVSETELKEIKHANKNPTVVYSLTDSKPSETPLKNNQSCSDYQISYNDGFFETEETIYLLMGKGFRKIASARLVSLLKD
jgi:subtilase family serine protease